MQIEISSQQLIPAATARTEISETHTTSNTALIWSKSENRLWNHSDINEMSSKRHMAASRVRSHRTVTVGMRRLFVRFNLLCPIYDHDFSKEGCQRDPRQHMSQ
jgi:hypothetical protein